MNFARVAIAAALGIPALACAHAFEERYDLPAPLSYFMTGAALVVILSFAVAQVVVEHAANNQSSHGRVIRLGLLPCEPCVSNTCKVYGVPQCLVQLDENLIASAVYNALL